jgi:hypothetical protein
MRVHVQVCVYVCVFVYVCVCVSVCVCSVRVPRLVPLPEASVSAVLARFGGVDLVVTGMVTAAQRQIAQGFRDARCGTHGDERVVLRCASSGAHCVRGRVHCRAVRVKRCALCACATVGVFFWPALCVRCSFLECECKHVCQCSCGWPLVAWEQACSRGCWAVGSPPPPPPPPHTHTRLSPAWWWIGPPPPKEPMPSPPPPPPPSPEPTLPRAAPVPAAAPCPLWGSATASAPGRLTAS